MSRLLVTTLLACAAMPMALAAGPDELATGPSAYRSAFDTYQPWIAELPVLKWRSVNEEMERLGGHIGHVRATTTGSDTSKENLVNHGIMHGSHAAPATQGSKP